MVTIVQAVERDLNLEAENHESVMQAFRPRALSVGAVSGALMSTALHSPSLSFTFGLVALGGTIIGALTPPSLAFISIARARYNAEHNPPAP